MYIVSSYPLAVVFCCITMLCWGSWANTSKCTNGKWQFPLFYWDYSIGLLIMALIYGLTLGSYGLGGRSFFEDLAQANIESIGYAFMGGTVFNLSNLLVVAAIALTGLSVAFPIAVGLALVLGVVINYVSTPTGNPWILFLGVGLVVIAMLVNASASSRMSTGKETGSRKGIVISVIAGIIMAFFYRFVAKGMTTDFMQPMEGKLTPYSAVMIFSLGVFFSNFLWNSIFMYKPVVGVPTSYKHYFTRGTWKQHLIGISGGFIFNTGFLFNLIASEKAGPAISYGLGQGATMIGAAWGIFVFHEFKGANRLVKWLLTIMFLTFFAGLSFIIIARNV